jgi:hypothetical protein
MNETMKNLLRRTNADSDWDRYIYFNNVATIEELVDVISNEDDYLWLAAKLGVPKDILCETRYAIISSLPDFNERDYTVAIQWANRRYYVNYILMDCWCSGYYNHMSRQEQEKQSIINRDIAKEYLRDEIIKAFYKFNLNL